MNDRHVDEPSPPDPEGVHNVREAELMDRVDQHPDSQQPTEADEEEVLRDLYGEPDRYGIHCGEGS
ncbi:hypothetical protein ACFY4C_20760 [Actinomadura viridis]|uniref:hypothetical protein n=1 Tax=Actinomadura viridis TaxID=58110 RepID=UPI0036B864D6